MPLSEQRSRPRLQVLVKLRFIFPGGSIDPAHAGQYLPLRSIRLDATETKVNSYLTHAGFGG